MAKNSKKAAVSKKTPAGKGAKSAPVSAAAKKATATESAPRKTWSDTAKEPKSGQSVMDACIELMRKPGGCGIKDFQEVKGFKYPSMAVVRAANARGYKATFTKEPGSRTVYKATGSATK